MAKIVVVGLDIKLVPKRNGELMGGFMVRTDYRKAATARALESFPLLHERWRGTFQPNPWNFICNGVGMWIRTAPHDFLFHD